MKNEFYMRIIYFDSYNLVLGDDENSNYLKEDMQQSIKLNPNFKLINLDLLTYSHFMERKIYSLPIIRLYGTTCRGQKCCLNVHNVTFT